MFEVESWYGVLLTYEELEASGSSCKCSTMQILA